MATSNRIRVSVIEGYYVSLQEAGLPLSVCIQLQECKLSLSHAQWTARQTSSGFSVSLFWPEQLGAQKAEKGRRRSVERGVSAKWTRLCYPRVPVAPLVSHSYLALKQKLQHRPLFQMMHTPPQPSSLHTRDGWKF